MQRLTRFVIAAAAVTVALGAAFFILWLNPPGAKTEDIVFSDHGAVDVSSVSVENQKGSFEVSAQDGGYVITDVPAELVDMETFIGFMVACSDVKPLQRIDTDGQGLDAFGLETPQATVHVTYQDDAIMSLSIGNEEPLSGNYYCQAEGEKGVFLLAKQTAENYLVAKEAFISFYVTPKLAVSSPLSALRNVTFTGGTLQEPVTIEAVSGGDEEIRQLARSFGAATHIVRGAGVYELDQTYGLTVLQPLCGLTAQAIVKYGLTADQEDAMGFAQPYMQVAFDYPNGGDGTDAHYVLRLLPAKEDGSLFYANVAGSGTVFVVARPAFADISYEKLLLRWFLSPLLMDVSGITIENGSQKTEFLLDQTDKKNPVVTMNGEALDVDLFRSFFALLGSAANDGAYLGEQAAPNGNVVMKVTYHYTDGKADDVMALYTGDSRRVNVYINGVCEYAMKDTFVSRVTQAVAAMKNGESFDSNW